MKKLGVFWSDSNIEVYEIEGKAIALACWNGEEFTNCFEVSECDNGKFYNLVNLEVCYHIKPIYKEVNDDFEIIGYKFC